MECDARANGPISGWFCIVARAFKAAVGMGLNETDLRSSIPSMILAEDRTLMLDVHLFLAFPRIYRCYERDCLLLRESDAER